MESLLHKNPLESYVAGLSDEVLNSEFDEIFKNAPVVKDSRCGFSLFNGRFIQK